MDSCTFIPIEITSDVFNNGYVNNRKFYVHDTRSNMGGVFISFNEDDALFKGLDAINATIRLRGYVLPTEYHMTVRSTDTKYQYRYIVQRDGENFIVKAI